MVGETKKTYSMKRNKNTLELKTASDGPVVTNPSHVLETVILEAAKERIKTLSRRRITDAFWSARGRNRER